MIEFKINGGKELAAMLAKLPIEVETKILGNGLAAGASIIRDEAKARIRKRSGRTAAAIKTARSTNKAEGYVAVKIKVDRSRAFIANFLEHGVAAHQIWARGSKLSLVINGVPIGRQVWHPGFAPKPFMRPALDAKAGEAVQAFGEYLAAHLSFGTITAPLVAVDQQEAA